ncbi:hypothetical protein J2R78_008822 [Bradyrhizobium sp. USDA 4538]|uniref:hypothetical protein n=1 Tax=unclassified Bradyrhizobium TaxID=2631580 RepID=UPI00209F851F|nr:MULTISPECIES: hypothetical protein [unclassified Bradyrhizobium]MCP1845788.1 hypothetical protein [Bradyrhizobium sp. USDA 4538]MCP1906889.1 hypothetical protein [Bradyrhizobium sp. USDA 4537]MCP1985364.1 hypothetical protein [Bradyrhizobium sp. USDA 4539]
MKSQDIVVLLKLVCLQDYERAAGIDPFRKDGEDPYSVRGLEASLGISKTEIAASIKRSLASAMAIKDRMTGRPDPNRRNLRDFITYGLKFVFPAKPGPMQRGAPTAFAASVLKDSLYSAGNLNPRLALCARMRDGPTVSPSRLGQLEAGRWECRCD